MLYSDVLEKGYIIYTYPEESVYMMNMLEPAIWVP